MELLSEASAPVNIQHCTTVGRPDLSQAVGIPDHILRSFLVIDLNIIGALLPKVQSFLVNIVDRVKGNVLTPICGTSK